MVGDIGKRIVPAYVREAALAVSLQGFDPPILHQMFKARDFVPGLFCLDMQKHTDSLRNKLCISGICLCQETTVADAIGLVVKNFWTKLTSLPAVRQTRSLSM